MGLWDKYVVPPLISCACSSKPIMRQREKVVPKATGHVLELGCGSGTNFSYYDPSTVEHLTALEPSPEMLARARTPTYLYSLSLCVSWFAGSGRKPRLVVRFWVGKWVLLYECGPTPGKEN